MSQQSNKMMNTMIRIWRHMLLASLLHLVTISISDLPADPPDRSFLLVISGLGVMLAVLSLVLPGVLRKQAVARTNFQIDEELVTTRQSLFRETPPVRRIFAKPNDVLERTYSLSFAYVILAVILAHCVTILGVVAAFMGADLGWIAAFFVIGCSLVAWHFPTQARLLSPVEKHYDALYLDPGAAPA